MPQPAQIARRRGAGRRRWRSGPTCSPRRATSIAASADVVASRRRSALPRITLAGSIGAARFETGAGTLDGTLWSIGPLAVSLPIFDGGTRARQRRRRARALRRGASRLPRQAARRGARGRGGAGRAAEHGRPRSDDAQIAADGFDASYRATEARYRGGLASLFELEDARRSAAAGAERADRPAARARRGLDRAVPRARRRLDAPPTQPARARPPRLAVEHHRTTDAPVDHMTPALRRLVAVAALVAALRRRRRRRSACALPTTTKPAARRAEAGAHASPSTHAAARDAAAARSPPTATSPPGRKRASAPRRTACAWPRCASTSATSSSAARCSRPSRPTRCRPTLRADRAPPSPRPRRRSPKPPPTRSARASCRRPAR